MLTALNEKGEIVISYINGNKKEHYFCPNPKCNKKLIFKNGLIYISHFAHFSHSDCENNEEHDSEEHRFLKLAVYNTFKNIMPDLKFEKWVNNNRADLLSETNKIVFECQFSNMNYEKIKERTENWENNGYTVIWILHKKYFKEHTDYDYFNKGQKILKLNSMMIYLYNKYKKLFYVLPLVDKNSLNYFIGNFKVNLIKATIGPYSKIIRFNKYKTKESGRRFIYKHYYSKGIKYENNIGMNENFKIEELLKENDN
jgi:competence CoiA-like predicted nuclease